MLPEENIPPSGQFEQKPKRGYGFLLILTALLIIAGGFGIWYFSQSIPNDSQYVSTSVDRFADWKTYRNEEYGFEVKLPKSWDKLKIVEELNYFNEVIFNVYLPTSIENYSSRLEGYASQFYLQPFSMESWDKLVQSDEPKPVWLAKNDTYVFAYGKTQDVPPDQFERYEEIDQILSTFKFIPTSAEKNKCIDSNDQCREKPDKTVCTTGIWCDEEGNICGGSSCVGTGLGECFGGKCIIP